METGQRTSFINEHRLGLGVTVAAITLASATGGIIVNHTNTVRAGESSSRAEELARQRNTCHMQSVEMAQQNGSMIVRVIVSVSPNVLPATANDEYDGPLMDTTFTDGTGNLESGLAVRNPAGHWWATLNENNQPDGPNNQVDLRTDGLRPDLDQPGTYDISRFNTVRVKSEGLLVDDHYDSKMAIQHCGAIRFDGTLARIAP